MKNMLCNLVEDMLTNWSDARDSVLAVKSRIAEIDAQLTAMDNSFSWKGTAGISGHGSLNGGGHDWGGGGRGSSTGGLVLAKSWTRWKWKRDWVHNYSSSCTIFPHPLNN